MSEPDISTLARRLAEQNNVEWRSLGGSGPSGKVVERDVLDYLARVMAGMEDIDSTPEPLPEGLEAWPDQEAPGARHDVSTVEAEVADAAAREHTEPVVPTTAEAPTFEDHSASAPDPVADDLLSDDIFLFESEEPRDQAAPSDSSSFSSAGAAFGEDGVPPEDVGFVAGQPFSTGATPIGRAEGAAATAYDPPVEAAASPSDLPDEVSSSPSDYPDDVDDLLLVEDEADVVHDQAYDPNHGAAAASFDEEPTPAFEVQSSDQPAASGSGFSANAFSGDFSSDPVLERADSYTEPDGDDADSWGVQPQPSDPFGFSDDSSFESADDESLPDLWASEDSPPQEVAAAEPFSVVEPVETDGPWLSSPEVEPEVETPSVMDEALASASDAWHDDSDVLDQLEEAEHLDELDALEDIKALDGSPAELDIAAAVAALPLVRSGAVLRRHLDVSALAAAQLAVGAELGGDPLEAAPFLLRAVAKAATELGIIEGQVALAELRGGFTLRRVDSADSRSFRSLVEELQQDGSEEDEVGLVAVDLSGLDVDEVVLDVDAPAVTLGRILYDNQHGAYRSTLALTGELPLEQGAKLLGRVAELLDAPVRLLL